MREFELDGAVTDAAPTSQGLAVLLAFYSDIVAAKLALLDAEGTATAVALPGVRAGMHTESGRQVRPSLAVDPATGTIYVVDAHKQRVLEIGERRRRPRRNAAGGPPGVRSDLTPTPRPAAHAP